MRNWNGVICKRSIIWLVVGFMAVVVIGVGVIFNSHICKINLTCWDREISFSTRLDTVEKVLEELNIYLAPGDLVTPALDTTIVDGLEIEISRARPVFIHRKGKSIPVFTAEGCVGSILSSANIKRDANDVVYPDIDQNLPEDRIIKVANITYGEILEEELIDYDTQRREDSSLEAGITKIYKPGVKGLMQITYQVKYEDGIEVFREEKSRSKVKDASPQVILVGSLQQVSRGGQDIRFDRALAVKSTAYCPCALCCGATGVGKTCTGVPAAKGVVAVDPEVIPLGTRVYIDGYGYALAADVGSAIKGNKIDVCFDTHAEALAWGLRDTKVYILKQ